MDPMNETTVRIEINQQQAQMLDRLIAEGQHGADYGEVVRAGFLHFCRSHPELGATPDAGAGREAAGDD